MKVYYLSIPNICQTYCRNLWYFFQALWWDILNVPFLLLSRYFVSFSIFISTCSKLNSCSTYIFFLYYLSTWMIFIFLIAVSTGSLKLTVFPITVLCGSILRAFNCIFRKKLNSSATLLSLDIILFLFFNKIFKGVLLFSKRKGLIFFQNYLL